MPSYRQRVRPIAQAHLADKVTQVLADFLARQRKVLADIDAALVPVADAIDSFARGGKRLRPAFAYWGARGAGAPDKPELVAAVAALELVQASALIHDDVMDASDTRRGEPAVHRRFSALHVDQGWAGDPAAFGAGSAILLGDLCLAWSDELLWLSGLDLPALERARPVFDLMRTEVIAGQYLDIHTQASGDTSVQRALTVARYKSAKYTVERPLLFGAAIAAAPASLRGAYSRFGLPLGEAFQLRDDVLGVFGDPLRTGKPAGDDLREGKRTYLVATAFETANAATAAELRRRLGDPYLDEQGVSRLRQILTDTGALRRTEIRIAALTETALAALAEAELDEEADAGLNDLALAATRRSL